MKKFLLIFLLFISIDAYSCSCLRIESSLKSKVEKAFSKSDIIFNGKVIDIEVIGKNQDDKTSFNYRKIRYSFQINRVYKGKIINKTIRVISNENSAACGYKFSLNISYLVYSYNQKNSDDIFEFATDICTRTQLFKSVQRKELRYLKRISKD